MRFTQNLRGIFQQTARIIDADSIPIVVDDDVNRWAHDSFLRGYHAYMDIWVPLIGDDSLVCRKEGQNRYICTLYFHFRNEQEMYSLVVQGILLNTRYAFFIVMTHKSLPKDNVFKCFFYFEHPLFTHSRGGF